MPLDAARALMFEAAMPIERRERIAIGDATNRVLAQPVTSRVDVPPFDRAAMDGYAVIAGDTSGASGRAPRRLRCIGRVFTGQAADVTVTAGACVEVATGAPLPPGADAVVMVEAVEYNPGYGWDALIPALESYRIPGDHLGILAPPNVDLLAEKLRLHLAK